MAVADAKVEEVEKVVQALYSPPPRHYIESMVIGHKKQIKPTSRLLKVPTYTNFQNRGSQK